MDPNFLHGMLDVATDAHSSYSMNFLYNQYCAHTL